MRSKFGLHLPQSWRESFLNVCDSYLWRSCVLNLRI